MIDNRFCRFWRAAIAVGVVAVVTAVILPAGTASAAPSSTLRGALNVCNDGISVGLGVIHTSDGAYALGNYDAVLPVGQCTYQNLGWPHVGGLYVNGEYADVIDNHAHQYITSFPTFNDHQGHWYFIDNPNELYYVHTCHWYGGGSVFCDDV